MKASEAIGKITYSMIGDPAHVISRNFDVLIEDEGLADRGTFHHRSRRYHPSC